MDDKVLDPKDGLSGRFNHDSDIKTGTLNSNSTTGTPNSKKEALQAEVGLPVDRNIPSIGFIGRLEEQTNSNILAATIPKLLGSKVQIVILLHGDAPSRSVMDTHLIATIFKMVSSPTSSQCIDGMKGVDQMILDLRATTFNLAAT